MPTTEYDFSVSTFSTLIDEAYDLWQEHHDELVGSNVKFLPDLQKYLQVEKAGHLKVYVVRKNKKLVGYSVFTVATHHHRTQIITAENTLFFITKEHRKGWLASNFIKYCEESLFTDGVTQIHMRTKIRASFGILLKRLKYKEEEIVYIKKKE